MAEVAASSSKYAGNLKQRSISVGFVIVLYFFQKSDWSGLVFRPGMKPDGSDVFREESKNQPKQKFILNFRPLRACFEEEAATSTTSAKNSALV
jgi:hypothetical protein